MRTFKLYLEFISESRLLLILRDKRCKLFDSTSIFAEICSINVNLSVLLPQDAALENQN